jgi:hypothetical protein
MQTFFGDHLPVDTFDSGKDIYLYCGNEQNSIIFSGDAGKYILFYRSLLYSYDYISAILLDVEKDIAYVSIPMSEYDWCIKRIENPMMDFLISKKFLSKDFRVSYCTEDSYRRSTSLIYFPQPVQLGHYIINCLSPMARVSSLFNDCSSSAIVSSSPSNFLSTSFLADLAESNSLNKPAFHVFPTRNEALLYANQNQLSPCEIHGFELNYSLSSKIKEVIFKRLNSSSRFDKIKTQPTQEFKIVFGIRSKTRVLINILEFISRTVDMVNELVPGPLHVVIDGMCSTHIIGSGDKNENSAHYTSTAEEASISDTIVREIARKGIRCVSTVGKSLDEQLCILYNSNIVICPQGSATIKYIGLLGIPTFSHGPLNLDKQFKAIQNSNFKASGYMTSSIFSEWELPVPEQIAPNNSIFLQENPESKLEWDIGKCDTRHNYFIDIDVCHTALIDFLKSLPY